MKVKVLGYETPIYTLCNVVGYKNGLNGKPKNGLKVIKVNPAHSSTTCPKCGTLMKESDYRTFRCPNCGFEEHRDYIAVMNLYGRGLLHLSTAHGVKGGRNRRSQIHILNQLI